jgi:hypothetical protein
MKNQKAAKATKTVAAVVAAPQTAEVAQTVPNNPQSEVKTMVLQLKKTKVNKAGEVYFSFGAGSIRMSKSVFVADATLPETLSLEVPEGVFAPAGTVRVGGGGGSRVPSPEKLAKLQASATKAADRAKKAQEKALKALKAAQKAGVAPTEPIAATEPTAEQVPA